jgi:hypothetical protein
MVRHNALTSRHYAVVAIWFGLGVLDERVASQNVWTCHIGEWIAVAAGIGGALDSFTQRIQKICYCRFASAADTRHLGSNIVMFWSCLIRHSVVSRIFEVLAGGLPNRGSNLEQAGRAPKCGLGGFLVFLPAVILTADPEMHQTTKKPGRNAPTTWKFSPHPMNAESAADSVPKVN